MISTRLIKTFFNVRRLHATSLGQRNGKLIKPPDCFPRSCCANVPRNAPRFKSRKSKQTARLTKRAFRVSQHKVYLAKIGKLKVVCSRKLPAATS